MSNKKKNKKQLTKKNIKTSTVQEDRLFQRRLGAFLIDWVIVALLINITTTLPRTITSGVITTDNYFPGFAGNEGYILGGISFLVAYFYMVIFPFLFKETLGKRWLHIKIVKKDNSKANFVTRNLRFFVTTICEPRLFNFSLVFYLLISMVSGIHLGTAFEIMSWVLTILSGIFGIASKNGMFHDMLANTKVISVEKEK